MTTTRSHAAPWTFRRFMAQFARRRATPNLLQTHARTWSNPAVMTGREAVARHLFGEACHWGTLDMLEYDNTPRLRGGWLAEADRRIAGGSRISTADADIAGWYGLTLTQWDGMSALAKVDKREGYAQARGLAS